ncbi:MAG: protein arginine kinase [Peptococcaceae bacterium]|nr:protein arginine kinase [Peptococcaceae bacterium]
MSIRETVNTAHSRWMDAGPQSDVVVSSRVRAARNLIGLPFPNLLSEAGARQIFHSVRLAVENSDFVKRFGRLEITEMSELTPVEKQILVEKHLISPDLLENYQKKAVVLGDDEIISIMVNEEDHLRLQCILPGLQLREAWEKIDSIDDGLEKTLEYAYDESLGYLTACPTNVGTGLRASVMLHLPGLVLINRIRDVLGSVSKLGLTVRGLYGEGTDASGNLFQLSNQVTLGQAEEDIIEALISVTGQVAASERAAREALLRERREHIEDRVGRAYGLLKHARIMSSEEAVRLLSDLRLGVSLKIIDYIPASVITELMVAIRPAFLVKRAGKELSALSRDVIRAGLIRETLAKGGN